MFFRQTLEALVADDYTQAIQRVSAKFRIKDEILSNSPHFLVGTVDQIVEEFQKLREKYGISYITVLEPNAESFAPVVARLAGR